MGWSPNPSESPGRKAGPERSGKFQEPLQVGLVEVVECVPVQLPPPGSSKLTGRKYHRDPLSDQVLPLLPRQ
jgi:hypothetical protein